MSQKPRTEQKNVARVALQGILANLTLSGSTLNRPEGIDARPIIINFLLDNNLVSTDELHNLVHESLISHAKAQLTLSTNGHGELVWDERNAPVIGYAFNSKAVDESTIRFGNEKTAKDYVLQDTGLFNCVMTQLRTNSFRL